MTIGIARRRARPRWAVLLIVVPALVLTAASLALGSIAGNSGFEGADGNLAATSGTDWNSFSPATWTSTVPYQSATKTVNGWSFLGLTDAQASTSDTGFAGGTKQDVDCASIIGSKAPNKDDLKRIYLASKSGSDGHIYLGLAWERIPQNSTTASAHVGFEFNQATSGACPAGSGGLVKRTPGDLLFVYDFTGGSAGVATLTVRKWVSTGACDISSDTAPCWAPAVDLTASHFAEAAVDDGAANLPYPISDTVAPSTDSLGQSEFGEAIVDLTAANIFSANTCQTFGQTEAVSRSSGNSGQAAMEDLVGPKGINISNCGTVTIIKHTDPRGQNQSFSYTTTLGAGFSLNDTGNTTADSAGNTKTFTSVQPGRYTVTEGAEPAGYQLESLSCTATGSSSSGSQDTATPAQANITVAAGESVTCTYTNQATGTIKIIKHTDPRGIDQPFGFTAAGGLSPTSFNLNDAGNTTADSAGNTKTYSNVPVGSYSVTEGAEPAGFALESVSCTTGGSQDDTTPAKANIVLTAGATVACTYTNEKLATITIIKHTNPRGIDHAFSFTDGGLSPSSFSLNDAGNTTADSSGNTRTFSDVMPGSYTVTEGAEPSGFGLGSVSCSASGTGSSGARDGSTPAKANITVGAGGSVTCTYTNNQLYGAILVKKVSTKSATQLLDGASFSITGPNSYSSGTLTTADNATGDGTVCVDGLVFGSYTVTETAAPTGYAIDTESKSVTVNAAASCADLVYVGASIIFTDTPLTDITVGAQSQVTDGTKSQITCTDGDGVTIATSGASFSDPADASATGLKPGTYTCTIVVDP